MALLARSLTVLVKTVLFLAIYALALRLIHTYPLPMPEDQQHILFAISQTMGIRDPDDLYIITFAVVDLIVAIAAYWSIMKIWRHGASKDR
ncbi:MAG TPA: hypothetical protein VL689_14470 [Paraburkholderia sp.]|jgi:hypothetical protein|nr:hypothetical protein [Paraburkholderia sp.]